MFWPDISSFFQSLAMIHSLAGITIGTNFLLKTSAKILNKILPQKQCDQFFIRVNFCKNQSGIRADLKQKSGQNRGKNRGIIQ